MEVAVTEMLLKSRARNMNCGYPMFVWLYYVLFDTFTRNVTNILNSVSVISMFYPNDNSSIALHTFSFLNMCYNAATTCLKFLSDRPAWLKDNFFSASEYSTCLITFAQRSTLPKRQTCLYASIKISVMSSSPCLISILGEQTMLGLSFNPRDFDDVCDDFLLDADCRE